MSGAALRVAPLVFGGRSAATRGDPSQTRVWPDGWSGLLLAGTVALGACHPTLPPPVARPETTGATSSLVGRWDYRAPPGASRALALLLDSASDTAFFCHVARWMAGDLGVAPDAFGRCHGSIRDGRLSLTIGFSGGAEPIAIEALRQGGDTLVLTASRRGSAAGPLAVGTVFARAGADH